MAGRDQLFKQLLQEFFADFWYLFFPAIAAQINFDTVTFLDKETFTDLPDGSQREADVVAQAETVDGVPELLLLHIEIESERRGNFPFRLFQYYWLLRLRYNLPVLPVVIYLAPGTGGVVIQEYTESLLGDEVVRFRYRAVGVPDLNEAEYLQQDNPVALALSPLMRSQETERVSRWVNFVVQEASLPLNPAQQALLLYLLENALPLSPEENSIFRERLQDSGTQETETMQTIFERWGMEQGLEQGQELGRLAAKRDTLRRLCVLRFGPLSEENSTRINQISDEATLDRYTDRVLTATSVEEIFAP
ncbi:MAG: DUF4351 domain-containing protein [Armatimonadaceae bacterium]